MRRLRARLGAMEQLECFLLWPMSSVAAWCVFTGLLLTNTGPGIILYLFFTLLLTGWAIWRFVGALRHAHRYKPPPWEEFSRYVTSSADFLALSDTQLRSLLIWIFADWGYECRSIGDGGTLLLLWEGRWCAEMQCITRPTTVGVEQVRALVRRVYDQRKEMGCYLVTPFCFDLPARCEGATTPNVQLVDGVDLIRWMRRRDGELHLRRHEAEENASARVSAELALV